MKSLKMKHQELCELITEERTKDLLHKWYNRVIVRERKRKGIPVANKEEFMTNVVVIIAHLNTLTGLEYRPTSKDTQTLIKARFNDGFTVEDFKKVHEVKCKEWLTTDSRTFLRPSTLYRGSKFEGYLQQYKFTKIDSTHQEQKKFTAKLVKKAAIKAEEEDSIDPEVARNIVSNLLKNISGQKDPRRVGKTSFKKLLSGEEHESK